MPRVELSLDIRLLAQADTAVFSLTSDNLITRNRDIIAKSSDLAIALARLVAQVVYRLASERYREDGDTILMTVELTISELEAIHVHAKKILWNIDTAINYYEGLLKRGKAKSKSAVEARIAALKLWRDIIEQLSAAYEW